MSKHKAKIEEETTVIWWPNLSVELPEAYILAKQMNAELTGKEISACNLQNCIKFQRLGFINMYLSDFDRLVGCKVEGAVSGATQSA